MKVLQVPFTYYPDAVGGTEVYVAALAQRLAGQGVECVIAAPGSAETSGEHAGLRVCRYPVNQNLQDVREMYDAGDEAAAAAFDRILEHERPQVVHLHAFTRGVSLRAARHARRRGIPVAYTYHTPTATCLRGTLMRWGREVCDGLMEESLCAACTLEGKGMSRAAARGLAALPEAISALPGRCGLSGGAWTAWRMRELVALRQRTAREFLREADAVVAVCEWVRAVLLRNGVPAEKITLSRQGLCQEAEAKAESGKQKVESRQPSAEISAFHFPLSALGGSPPLRVAFLGRLDPTKGVEILLHAVKGIPDARLTLDIFGIAQGEGGERFARSLRTLAEGDSRITFRPPVPATDVVSTLRGYDVLAVPSQWLESGPMVVLEAFAAGVPVVGSRLGGIAELVRHEVDGLLVEPADVAAWKEALQRASSEAELLPRLRAGIRAPRTMDTVAGEMAELYGRLLARPRDAAARESSPAVLAR